MSELAMSELAMNVLAGKTVLLTRHPQRVQQLAQALTKTGARVFLLPLIDYQAVPVDLDPLEQGRYEWLVFTSATTVAALLAAAKAAKADEAAKAAGVAAHNSGLAQKKGTLAERIPAGTRVVAVGAATQAALEAQHIQVDFVPEHESAHGLLTEFPSAQQKLTQRSLEAQRIWLPQSNLAPETLAQGLRAAGADVTVTTAYCTVPYPADPSLLAPSQATDLANVTFPASLTAEQVTPEQAQKKLEAGEIDAVVLASGSAAVQFVAHKLPRENTAIIAIGESTAIKGEELGLRIAAVAKRPDSAGILMALDQGLSSQEDEITR